MTQRRFSPFVFIILSLSFISGCISSQTTANKPYSSRDGYIPREMEWIVTKLQANARVPWGVMGQSYSIEYKQGVKEGEIEAQVKYRAADNIETNAELYSAIYGHLAAANNLLSAEYFPGDLGVRRKLYIKVKPMPIGKKLDQIEELEKSF